MHTRLRIFMLCLVVLVFQFIGYVPRLTAMDVQSDMKSEAIGLVKKMITQENDRDIEEQLYLYAEHAEIGGRKLNISEIRKELSAYYELWPQAEWVLLEEPVFKNIDDTRSEIVYKAKYRLQSATRKKWSSGVIVSTMGLVSINGMPRISYIKDATSDVRNGDFSEDDANGKTAINVSQEQSRSDPDSAKDTVASNGRPMEALLIANSDYSNFPKLGSPKTDALLLGDALRKLGFATRLVENASREQMLDEINSFEERLRHTQGIAFFHFGGHGIQVDGKNYLVPSDAAIPDERRVSTRAVELNEVMGALDASGSEVNIVVLDACRDNPLPASATRSATRGLAVVGSKPKNSIVIYAAEAGSKANDGLFTPALARELAIPGRSLSEIMTRVRKEVNDRSGGTQIPGEYNQLFEQVFFNGGQGRAVAPASTATPTSYQNHKEVEEFHSISNTSPNCNELQQSKINGMEFVDGESNFRSGPGYGFPVKYQPPKGAWCELIEQQGSWIYVRMRNGDQGWVDRGNIKPSSPSNGYSGEDIKSSADNDSIVDSPEIDSQRPDDLGKEMAEMLKAWILANSQNNINAYADLLDEFVDYEYVKGCLATRDKVLMDFGKNINRWPIRTYHIRDDKFTWKDHGKRATINFSMDYQYADNAGRQAKGTTDVSIDVRRTSRGWVICRFNESVHRKRNDKKGM